MSKGKKKGCKKKDYKKGRSKKLSGIIKEKKVKRLFFIIQALLTIVISTYTFYKIFEVIKTNWETLEPLSWFITFLFSVITFLLRFLSGEQS